MAEHTDFTWDGAVLAEQSTTVPAVTTNGVVTTWDYQPGTFTPVTQSIRPSARVLAMMPRRTRSTAGSTPSSQT